MAGRRFFQISIRTLLILTTLVAVGMAYWSQILQRVREQKLATARILQLGGKAIIRPTGRDWPGANMLVGDDFFQEVVDVDMYGTLVTDADLELVGKLRGMKSLSLEGADGWSSKPSPHNPQQVGSQISGDGIRRLGIQRNMEIARLAQTPIADEALETIASWSHLEILDIQRTKVTSRGVAQLGKLTRLSVLNLHQTKMDDEVVPTLCQMKSLRELGIVKTAISGEGLLRLREALPSCKIQGDLWDLTSGIDPNPDSMRWKEITRPMWALSRSGDLKLLILAGTALTDLHLSDLDRLENVDVIDIRRTKVTKTGVETLQRLLPKCRIVW